MYFIGCLLCMNASVCCYVNSMVEYTALTTPQEGQNIYLVMMWWNVSLCDHLICCGVVWSGRSHVGKGLPLYLGSVVTVFLCTHTCKHTHTRCNLVELVDVLVYSCVCFICLTHRCQPASPPLLVPHRWPVCLHCFAVDTPLVFITPTNAILVVVPMSVRCC